MLSHGSRVAPALCPLLAACPPHSRAPFLALSWMAPAGAEEGVSPSAPLSRRLVSRSVSAGGTSVPPGGNADAYVRRRTTHLSRGPRGLLHGSREGDPSVPETRPDGGHGRAHTGGHSARKEGDLPWGTARGTWRARCCEGT